jgi:hypothetical protein
VRNGIGELPELLIKPLLLGQPTGFQLFSQSPVARRKFDLGWEPFVILIAWHASSLFNHTATVRRPAGWKIF